MKIVAFSDLHVHPHKLGHKIDPVTGLSCRVLDALKVLHFSHQLAHDVKADFRAFCGDMHHVRGRLIPSVANAIHNHYSSRDPRYDDILIPGNHDLEDYGSEPNALMNAITSLEQNRVRVLNGHGYEVIKSTWRGNVLGVGWVQYYHGADRMIDAIKQVTAQKKLAGFDGPSILMLHHGVDGALPSVPACGLAPAHLPMADFDLVLCGDYHNNAQLGPNAWMLGAPIHHNFGDAGTTRGVMVFDLATKTHELHQVPDVPRFVTWREGDPPLSLADIAGNYVRLQGHDQTALDAAKAAVLAAGAALVVGEVIDASAAVARQDISVSLTVGQMFEKWLDAQDPAVVAERAEIVALNGEILRLASLV